MEITVSKEFDYTPEWNGNKDDENPIVFHCRYLTNSELDRCRQIGSKITFDIRLYADLSIKSIDNLTVNGKPVCTAKDFLKTTGLGGLFAELGGELLERNSKEPEKK